MRPLLVSELGQPLLGSGKQLPLVNASELPAPYQKCPDVHRVAHNVNLHVAAKVLLVQDLQEGVWPRQPRTTSGEAC